MNNKNKHLEKAYKSNSFLNSADARTIRILAEYLEPQQRLKKQKIKDMIVFFGSARAKDPNRMALKQHLSQKIQEKSGGDKSNEQLLDKYYNDARLLAKRLTELSLTLDDNQRFVVCSGGGPGIMEAANRGAIDAGGRSIGMNISIPLEQEPNLYISDNLAFEFHYFFMRKFWFVYLAKAAIIFPGGFGTMDELFEVLTLMQTHKMQKRIPIVIYGEEYWNKVLNFDAMLEYGTIEEEDIKLFKFYSDVESAFEYIKDELTEKFIKGKSKPYWHF